MALSLKVLFVFIHLFVHSLDIADNILDIDALNEEQEQVLNSISVEYGMRGMDYSEYVSTNYTPLYLLRLCLQYIISWAKQEKIFKKWELTMHCHSRPPVQLLIFSLILICFYCCHLICLHLMAIMPYSNGSCKKNSHLVFGIECTQVDQIW